MTTLPACVAAPPALHLERVKRLHQRDLARGHGDVDLPDAMARKISARAVRVGWKFVFP